MDSGLFLGLAALASYYPYYKLNSNKDANVIKSNTDIPCIGGYINKEKKCICTNPDQEYDEATKICKCKVGGEYNGKCVSCTNGKVDNKGICNCEFGQIPNEGGICRCAVGGVFNSKCVSCADGAVNKLTGNCECNDGFLLSKDGECINYSSCANGTINSDGDCVCLVPSRMYIDPSGNCACKDPNADTSANCSTCKQGYKLNELNTCSKITCVGGSAASGVCTCNISGQQVNDSGVCTCLVGFYEFTNEAGITICAKCDGIVSGNSCTCSKSDQHIDNITGVCKCPANTYLFNNRCVACEGTVSGTACICSNGKTINETTGLCECGTNKYLNTNVTPNICVECTGGTIRSEKCICSGGKVANPDTTIGGCVCAKGSPPVIDLNADFDINGNCVCGSGYTTSLAGCTGINCYGGTMDLAGCTCTISGTEAAPGINNGCKCTDSNKYITNSGECILCGNGGTVLNNNSCTCVAPYEFNPTLGCVCPQGRYYSAPIGQCIQVAQNDIVNTDKSAPAKPQTVTCSVQGALTSYSQDGTCACASGLFVYNNRCVRCDGTVTNGACICSDPRRDPTGMGGNCVCSGVRGFTDGPTGCICNDSTKTVIDNRCVKISCIGGQIVEGVCICDDPINALPNENGVCTCNLGYIKLTGDILCSPCTGVASFLSIMKGNLITMYGSLNAPVNNIYPTLNSAQSILFDTITTDLKKYLSALPTCTLSDLNITLDTVGRSTNLSVYTMPLSLTDLTTFDMYILVYQRSIINKAYNFTRSLMPDINNTGYNTIENLPYGLGRLMFFDTTKFPTDIMYFTDSNGIPTDPNKRCSSLDCSNCESDCNLKQYVKNNSSALFTDSSGTLSNNSISILFWEKFMRTNVNNYVRDTSAFPATVTGSGIYSGPHASEVNTYLVTNHISDQHNLLINNFLNVKLPRKKGQYSSSSSNYEDNFRLVSSSRITPYIPIPGICDILYPLFDKSLIGIQKRYRNEDNNAGYSSYSYIDGIYPFILDIDNNSGVLQDSDNGWLIAISSASKAFYGNMSKYLNNSAVSIFQNKISNKRSSYRYINIFSIPNTTLHSTLSIEDCLIISNGIIFDYEKFFIYPCVNYSMIGFTDKTDDSKLITDITNGIKYIKLAYNTQFYPIDKIVIKFDISIINANTPISIMLIDDNEIILYGKMITPSEDCDINGLIILKKIKFC